MRTTSWFLILLLLLPVASAGWETKPISIHNESVLVTPQLDACEATTSVFHIQRALYESGMPELSFNYTYHQDNRSVEIEKSINKYSTSHTGAYQVSDTDFTLGFSHQGTMLNWQASGCTNSSVNGTTNEEEEKKTIPKETARSCPSNLGIDTSHTTRASGEKLGFSFTFEPWPADYAITYWIEDASGEDVKKAHTTTNNNEKSYTLTSALKAGSYLTLFAEVTSPCGRYEASNVIGIEPESEDEAIILEADSDTLHLRITNPEQDEYVLRVIDLDDEPAMQPVVLQPQGDVDLDLPHHITAAHIYKAILESDGGTHETYFEIQETKKRLELLNTYTRSTKLADNITWNVRSRGDAPYSILVIANGRIHNATITTDEPTTTSFTLTDLFANNTIHSLVIKDSVHLREELPLTHTPTFSEKIEERKQNLTVPPITAKATVQSPIERTKANPNTILMIGLGILSLIAWKGSFIKAQASSLLRRSRHEKEGNSD